MKKIVISLYFIILLFYLFAPKLIEANDEISVSVSANQPFSTNSIIVVMKNDLAKNSKQYDVADFEEVQPSAITNNDIYNTKFATDATVQEKSSLSGSNSDSYGQSLTLRWDKNFTKENIIKMIKILSQRDDVDYVQPNYYYELQSSTPLDTITGYRTYYNVCNVMEAWDYTTGSHAIKVGIIDSGIDGTHPDLVANLNNNLHKDFTSTNEQPLVDNYGHGTCVAGVVGARGNNGVGISGVCWDVSLVSLKVYDATDSSEVIIDSSKLKMAINYADANNIPILNFSGHLATSNGVAVNDITVKSALQNYDGLFVCSASNCAGQIGHGGYNDADYNNDNHPVYPANYSTELSNVISVGGLDQSGKRSMRSRYGKDSVTLFANYETYSTSAKDETGYQFFDGTSCSAPMVAGALALIYSMNMDFTRDQIKSILLNNCTDFSVGFFKNTSPSSEDSYIGKKLNLIGSISSIVSSTLPNLNAHIIQNTSYNDFSETASLSNNNINYNNKKFYKLTVIDAATYQFRIDNSLCGSISLYDSNYNMLDISNCNSIGQVTVFEPLSAGTYYVKVETYYNYIDNITLTIHREFDCYLSYDLVNSFTIDSMEDFNIRYVHSQESGFYNVILNLYNSYNGYLSDFPDNMLEIYSDDERSMLLAYTTYDDTTITIYLEQGKIYYFDIELNISDLGAFDITITENS